MRLTYGSLDLTDYPYSIEFGMDTGAPQNVYETLAFLLQDGEVALSDRASNRTVQFNVLIEGSDLAEAADAEAGLIAETEKAQNTLTLDPEDYGPPSVYDTFRGQVTLARDDGGEISRLRRYTVTVSAAPFVRSETETITTALPATGSTTTVLDNCSAATGWTGSIDGVSVTPVAASGAVSVTATVAKGSHSFTLQKTFAATTTSTTFLQIDWLRPAGGIDNTDNLNPRGVQATGDGVHLALLSEGPSPTLGYVRSLYQVSAASLAVTRLDYAAYFPRAGSASFTITEVDVTNVNPIIGNARQQILSLTVGGSAPAPGSLAVEAAGTTALGDGVSIYVYPSDPTTAGYTPPMRQFRTTGNTVTTDSTKVSGKTEPLNGGSVTFDVPIGLFPRGMYLLVGRLATAGGGTPTITYTTLTQVGGVNLLSTVATRALTITATYTNYVIGRMLIPTLDLDSRSVLANATAQMIVTSSTACTYDELWLYNTSIGSLTMLDCGSGTTTATYRTNRVYLDSPTTVDARPRIRTGKSADRSDSRYPSQGASSWQFLTFKPPQVNVHVVTPDVTNATVTLNYFKHWHTNAAE